MEGGGGGSTESTNLEDFLGGEEVEGSRDRLGVVGQYSTAWQRLQRAGMQQLVLAACDNSGERQVVGRCVRV